MRLPAYLIDRLLAKVPLPFSQRLMTAFCRHYLDSKAGHMAPSVILSVHDDVGPSDWLLRTALKAIAFANDNDLRDLVREHADKLGNQYYDVFPGEHYRLLSAVAAITAPQNIVEIGTYTGMSAVCFLRSMPVDCKLTAFDLVPWDQFRSHLDPAQFRAGRIVQNIADLSDARVFSEYRDLLETTGLIFCDAAKDGVFERKLLENLSSIKPRQPCLLILDDIRFLTMIDIWRSVESPKMDVTSFGHWTGTGMIDMGAGLSLK